MVEQGIEWIIPEASPRQLIHGTYGNVQRQMVVMGVRWEDPKVYI